MICPGDWATVRGVTWPRRWDDPARFLTWMPDAATRLHSGDLFLVIALLPATENVLILEHRLGLCVLTVRDVVPA